jgi:hypothetical protein
MEAKVILTAVAALYLPAGEWLSLVATASISYVGRG